MFAPDDPYFQFVGRHGNGPVPLLEVEELDAAHDELVAAGVEIVGAIEHDSAWKWLHLRAPDGNLYALGERRRASTADPGL